MIANGAHILLLDDDRDTIGMLEILLGMNGHKITSALTLEDGLQLVRAGGFDVCLLDNHLQEGRGYEACTLIRELDARMPIIFCSGDTRQTARQQALDAGAQVFLLKPVDTEELDRIIVGLSRIKQAEKN